MTLISSIIYLSLTASFPPYLLIEKDLKLNHILAYAVLMSFFAQILLSRRMVWFFAMLFVVMGIVLEYLQGMTGYRTFSYYDMCADALGVSVGLLISKTPLKNSVEYVDRKIAGFF